MAQKKKINISSSKKRKSPSASKSKKKLGDKSLSWITDTIEGEVILNEQGENLQDKSAGSSKESKIGVMKQYVYEGVEKKKEKTPEVIPGISGSSSTITKGEKVMSAKEEDEEKTISAEKTPVEIGKTSKISEEKEQNVSEEEKTVFDKKEDAPDVKKIPPEDEVKNKDITKGKKIKRKPSSAWIGLKNFHQLWKSSGGVSQEEKISKEDRSPSKKKKTVKLAAKEKMPPTEKRKWMKISGIYESLKKGSQKVSGTIVKPFKSGRSKFRKSASSIINVSKQPVKSISAVDRKITQSMKKVVSFSDTGNAKKSILKNIKSADTQITKSTKKMIDSILG